MYPAVVATAQMEAQWGRLTLFAIGLLLGGRLILVHNAWAEVLPPVEARAISREEMLVHFRSGQAVDQRVVRADDLVALLERDEKLQILITRSRIVGAIDLSRLPRIPLARIEMPQELRATLAARKVEGLRRVPHDLHIVNSSITGVRRHERWRQLGRAIDAEGVLFEGKVSFRLTVIGETALFSSAVFRQEADFTGTSFDTRASFNSAIFTHACFWRATFGGESSFGDVWFSSDASFFEARFAEFAHFGQARFDGKVDFSLVEFKGGGPVLAAANFHKAVFGGEAEFSGAAIVGGLAIFTRVTACDVLRFNRTAIEGAAIFKNGKIRRLDFLQDVVTIFRGIVDFRYARIGEAHFQNAVFEKDVHFDDAEFGGAAGGETTADEACRKARPVGNDMGERRGVIFRDVIFASDVSFVRTRFGGGVVFRGVNFKQTVDFSDAAAGRSVERFVLSHLSFGTLKLRWQQLPGQERWVTRVADVPKSSMEEAVEKEETVGGEAPLFSGACFFRTVRTKPRKVTRLELVAPDLERRSRVLLRLEKHFEKAGESGDANEVFSHRMLAERNESTGVGRVAAWIVWALWGLPFRYGTNLVSALLLTGGFVAGFGILYGIGDLRLRRPGGGFAFLPRLFELPTDCFAQDPGARVVRGRLMRALAAGQLSLYLTCKVGYRDTRIGGQIAGVDYKYLVWLQWAAGFYFLAALIVTASNTVPFLSRVVALLKPLL